MGSKKLFLLRGLPGSGKSTLAEHLSNTVFDADDWFTNPETGEYVFKPEELSEAHQNCQARTKQAMFMGCENIAVANTFTTEKELQPYYDLAGEFGYMVTTVIVENRHGGVSVHNVPRESLVRMYNRFSVKLMENV